MRVLVLALVVLLLAAAPAPARPLQDPGTPEPAPVLTPDLDAVAWRHSRALGQPFAHGRLIDGVQLPELGQDYFTWDPVLNRIPNRGWRRWGTDRLVRTMLTVIEEYRAERSSAQRIGIMDLSREHGGRFGRNYGGLGHASHQNGLDADVLYPRTDGREARAAKPAQVDQAAAQDLLDRFVAAGAVKVFVGPHLHLHGPKKIVVPLIYHDDHMHVRIR